MVVTTTGANTQEDIVSLPGSSEKEVTAVAAANDRIIMSVTSICGTESTRKRHK